MSVSLGGLALDAGMMFGLPLLSGGSPFEEIQSHFEHGSAFQPTKINLKGGLDRNQLNNFRDVVDSNPLPKMGSVGANMNVDYIVRKFRQKRAAARYQGRTKVAAGAGDIFRSVLEVAKPTLQTAMYGIGTGLLGSVAYDKYQDYTKAKDTYNEMFERFPELNEIDRKKVDDYWGIMDQYAPSMTLNPLVAGQFIKNMADYNMQGIDFPTLKSIMDIQQIRDKRQTDNLKTISSTAAQSII